MLEQVSVCPARSSVPWVNAAVVHNVVPARVVVIAEVLITKGPMDVFVRIDPVPTIVAVNAVRTLVLELDFNELKLRLVAAMVNAVVPKSISLNQLPVPIVGIEAPLTK